MPGPGERASPARAAAVERASLEAPPEPRVHVDAVVEREADVRRRGVGRARLPARREALGLARPREPLEPTERGEGVLRAPRRVVGEQREQRGVVIRRKLAVHRARPRARVARRRRPGEHLPQDRADAVEVAAGARRPSGALLGAHVLERAITPAVAVAEDRRATPSPPGGAAGVVEGRWPA